MKSVKKLLAVAVLVSVTHILTAQVNPPTPNGGTDPTSGGSGNAPVGDGGGAPIGGGLFILLGLGAAYGARKTYQFYIGNRESLEN
jgi:hypothetical protein